MRALVVLLGFLCVTGVGCGSTSGGGMGGEGASQAGGRTIDGLVETEIDMPGVLFIRNDHGIGSYDAFLIPEASISYRRASRRLPDDMEIEFMAALEQSLLDAADEARIPIVKQPGQCVMQVAMGLIDVDIERSSLRTLGTMTLVMEFRDTMSGAPLLRYASENRIENESTGAPRGEQLRAAFDEMVAEMEISGALEAAGLADGEIREGCQGTLAARGAAGLPAVSAGP